MKSRLPSLAQVIPVFGTIVFINFTWSIGRMFLMVPAWLNFLKVLEIFPIAGYVMATALAESLFILGILLVGAFILPAKLLKENFVPQGTLMVLFFTAATLVFHQLSYLSYDWTHRQFLVYSTIIIATVIVVAIAISQIMVRRLSRITRFLAMVAERMTVFLYLYLPLGLLSIVVIFIRNIR